MLPGPLGTGRRERLQASELLASVEQRLLLQSKGVSRKVACSTIDCPRARILSLWGIKIL